MFQLNCKQIGYFSLVSEEHRLLFAKEKEPEKKESGGVPEKYTPKTEKIVDQMRKENTEKVQRVMQEKNDIDEKKESEQNFKKNMKDLKGIFPRDADIVFGKSELHAFDIEFEQMKAQISSILNIQSAIGYETLFPIGDKNFGFSSSVLLLHPGNLEKFIIDLEQLHQGIGNQNPETKKSFETIVRDAVTKMTRMKNDPAFLAEVMKEKEEPTQPKPNSSPQNNAKESRWQRWKQKSKSAVSSVFGVPKKGWQYVKPVVWTYSSKPVGRFLKKSGMWIQKYFDIRSPDYILKP